MATTTVTASTNIAATTAPIQLGFFRLPACAPVSRHPAFLSPCTTCLCPSHTIIFLPCLDWSLLAGVLLNTSLTCICFPHQSRSFNSCIYHGLYLDAYNQLTYSVLVSPSFCLLYHRLFGLCDTFRFPQLGSFPKFYTMQWYINQSNLLLISLWSGPDRCTGPPRG